MTKWLMIALVGFAVWKYAGSGKKQAPPAAEAPVAAEEPVPGQSALLQRADLAWVEAETQGIHSALVIYSGSHNGEFPEGSTAEILRAIGYRPVGGGAGTFNGSGELLDKWNNPYRIVIHMKFKDADQGHGIYSFGPNGIDENRSGDDIVSWQPVRILN